MSQDIENNIQRNRPFGIAIPRTLSSCKARLFVELFTYDNILQDGKKFMWDGLQYDERGKAEEVKKEYCGNGFETLIVEAGESF